MGIACAQQEVSVGDRIFTVRELSYADVRAWFVEIDAQLAAGTPRDPLHAMAFADCGLDDLAHLCGVPVADLEQYSERALQPVLAAARALNSFFFRVRAELTLQTRALIEAIASQT